LSIITSPSVTPDILRQAKEVGISAVWLQPGTYNAETLESAKQDFNSVIGGEGGSGEEGWCILADGEDGLRLAGRDWENKPLPSPTALSLSAQRIHVTSGGASPSHTRLPSPPPIPEDQIGPRSPQPILEAEEEEPRDSSARAILDALSLQLKRPKNTHPIDRETAQKIAQLPPGVEKQDWLYSLARFHTQHISGLVVALFEANCSKDSCPEMRASEWQYLCSVHDPPKPCTAIDYSWHTLDWAGHVVTASKPATETQLANVFRRLYRIFAHAWFEHRDAFTKVESRTGIYTFFKIVCTTYGLINQEGYIIPDEAEEISAAAPTTAPAETESSGDLTNGESEPQTESIQI
jgi:hypothetical protein